MQSTKLQLLVTLAAVLATAGIFASRGLLPRNDIAWSYVTGDGTDVRRGIKWGVDVNSAATGFPPPMPRTIAEDALGVIRPDNEAVAVVLAYGAAVDMRGGPWGETPLHWAAARGRIDVAQTLLDRGADIGAQDDSGKTPLHIAARDGALAMADFLITHGASAKAMDRDGRTPLHVAAASPVATVIDITNTTTIHTPEPDDEAECMAREVASELRGTAMTSLLLDRGANVNARDAYGETPLFAAGWRPYITQLLIANGADLEVKSETSHAKGGTPLHCAIGRSADTARILIAAGANVNARDANGQTPLWRTIECRKEDIMKLLIARGADVNARDKDGQTPLHRAGDWGDVTGAEILILNGADVNATDNNGHTPLELAIKRNSGAADVLRQYRAKE